MAGYSGLQVNLLMKTLVLLGMKRNKDMIATKYYHFKKITKNQKCDVCNDSEKPLYEFNLILPESQYRLSYCKSCIKKIIPKVYLKWLYTGIFDAK